MYVHNLCKPFKSNNILPIYKLAILQKKYASMSIFCSSRIFVYLIPDNFNVIWLLLNPAGLVH